MIRLEGYVSTVDGTYIHVVLDQKNNVLRGSLALTFKGGCPYEVGQRVSVTIDVSEYQSENKSENQ